MNPQPTRLSPLYNIQTSVGATIVSTDTWQVARAIGSAADERATATAHVGLADLSDRAKIMVEGDGAAALLQSTLSGSMLAVNEVTHVADWGLYIASLRRDRFYISGVTGSESKLIDALNAAAANATGLITVTDATDARAELLLIGPSATTCLSRVCGLDFHESHFPNLTAKQSSVAKIRQLLLRCDGKTVPAYIIGGGRSYAAYLWETLLEAGHDLSMQAVGRQTVEDLWR